MPTAKRPWHPGKATFSVSYKILPTLPQLRHHLAIPTINTGRQINFRGMIFDDLEGLHAIRDEQGYTRLLSGLEFFMQAYRGQTREHKSCLPLLGRLKTHEEQLLALCRNIAFEDAISDHPFVQLAEKSAFRGHPLLVDKEGLAQHYGLSTHMIDFTSNFEIASFFATCALDPKTHRYLPLSDHQHDGMIYRITPVCLHDPATTPDRAFGPFHIVGWQPLPRPEQQRAFAVKMKHGQSLCELPAVERFPFRQRAKISHRIWKAFDEGRALFPPDAAEELAAQANTLSRFTRTQIDRAWQRLEEWTGAGFEPEQRHAIEKQSNINETTATILTWDGLDVETDKNLLSQKLAEILNRSRVRLSAYAK